MEGAPQEEDLREKLSQEIGDLSLELNGLMEKMKKMPLLPSSVSEENMKIIERSQEVSRQLLEKSNEYHKRNSYIKS